MLMHPRAQRQDLAWQDQSIGHDDQHLRVPVQKRARASGLLRVCGCASGTLEASAALFTGSQRVCGRGPGARSGCVRNPDDAVSSEQRREGCSANSGVPAKATRNTTSPSD